MKTTNTVAKLFSSVSTLAVVVGALAFNSVACGQVGKVMAWGNTTNATEVPIAAQSGVSAIAGGWYHTIAPLQQCLFCAQAIKADKHGK